MSEIKYGLISETDGKTIEKTLDLIVRDNSIGGFCLVHTLEVGVYMGDTSRGIRDYLKTKNGVMHIHVAIDNNSLEKVENPYPGCFLLIGDSIEMSHKIFDESRDFIFIDSNHSFHRVIADFVAFAPKVKPGGYLLFHDTKPTMAKFKDYQGEGDKKDHRMYICVREALNSIGLFQGAFPNWELVYDEYDPNDEGGGICVFRKNY